MADNLDTTTVPGIIRRKRITPVEAFHIVSDMERALDHATGLLQGLMHIAQCSDTMEAPDKTTVEEISILAQHQIGEVQKLRDEVFDGLHHFAFPPETAVRS